METLSALLAICTGNSPVTGEFPAQRQVTRSFDVFLDLPLNKRLSKQWWGWWFETPSCPLWRHCNATSFLLLYQYHEFLVESYVTRYRVPCRVVYFVYPKSSWLFHCHWEDRKVVRDDIEIIQKDMDTYWYVSTPKHYKVRTISYGIHCILICKYHLSAQ